MRELAREGRCRIGTDAVLMYKVFKKKKNPYYKPYQDNYKLFLKVFKATAIGSCTEWSHEHCGSCHGIYSPHFPLKHKVQR